MKYTAAFTCLVVLFISNTAFTGIAEKKIPQRKLTLVFHHMIGGNELVLDTECKNILGENITVRKFKYYLSNFSVTDNKGKTTRLAPQYFLVDEADPLSKRITLSVPDITVTHIGFLLGIDSIKNISGIQTGALDPLKGMFWTWNSGYIMAKLEGSSASSPAAGHTFAYHIGGFRKPMNTARSIVLDISKNTKLTEVPITADINHWFKSGSEIRTAETPVCHSPGPLAVKIADNYCTMFSVNSIH